MRILALGLLVLAALLAGNLALARFLPGGEWFFLRWSGTRAFLLERIELSHGARGARTMPDAGPVLFDGRPGPYSTEIAQSTQQIVYGRQAFSSEYHYVLTDPFFILLLYSPLALIPDFELARAFWMLLSEMALIGTVLLTFSLFEWQPRPWLYLLLLAFGVFHYFSLNAVFTGSPAILLVFLYLCILVALRSYSDELAGVLLALVAYQWEVGGLFFLFVLVFVVLNRRWGVLAGLAMALFVLLAISFLTNAGWGLPYIRSVLSSWNRSANLNAGYILATWLPNLRLSPGPILSIGLAIVLFLEWYEASNQNFRRVVWTAALSLAATPLMGLAIFSSNHVVLVPAFILILGLVWERWPRYRALRVSFLFILVLAIPFAMYARVVSVYDPLLLDLLSILPPVAAIVGLYWMRWWLVHSPRSLFERIGDR